MGSLTRMLNHGVLPEHGCLIRIIAQVPLWTVSLVWALANRRFGVEIHRRYLITLRHWRTALICGGSWGWQLDIRLDVGWIATKRTVLFTEHP